ncbi:MAG: RNA polymerase sigma factor [Saprospiraceae bacterium]|nr:RNA polymerase sigma factor [Saprospiraceae bacterium]MBP7680132.1 RNA polymerase sigma factor [Saprospiraceae bacterium]
MDIALPLQHQEYSFIDACVRQERWAQKKLYEDLYGSLMGVCLRYAGSEDEAVDILHEGFIKVFNNIGKYKPGTSLVSWARTIVINTCIDYYRKSVRRRTEDLDAAYYVKASDADALSQFTEKEILAAVQELTPAYRVVFNMYVLEGFSHKEIANELGITESTSRSNLVKARAKLQVQLSDHFVKKNAINEHED